jgi:hypothetical protein
VAICVLHEDESCLVWNGQGHGFFHHYRPDLLGASRTYAPEVLPNTFNRSGRLANVQYKLRPLGQHLQLLATHARQLAEAAVAVRVEKDAAPVKGSKEVESRQFVEGVGEFLLHRDKTIRVLFFDRTLLYVEPRPGTRTPLAVCRFVLPCGREYDAPLEGLLRPTTSSPPMHVTYSSHAHSAMEFWAWAALSPLERDAIRQKERLRNAIATQQCDRSRRLLLLQGVGQGKGWASSTHNSFSGVPGGEDSLQEIVTRALLALEGNKAVAERLQQARTRTAQSLSLGAVTG